MFVGQTSHTAASAALSSSSSRREPRDGEMRIDFPNGTSAYHPKKDLLQIDYFKKLEEIEKVSIHVLPADADVEGLRIILALVIEKKALWDILSNDQWQDPYLQENLAKALDAFYPSQKEDLLKALKRDQLQFINLETAQRTLTNYDTCVKRSEAIPGQVELARKVYIAAHLMDSPAKAERFFQKYVAQAREGFDAARMLESLSAQQVPKYKQEFVYIQTQAYMVLLQNLALKILLKRREVNPDSDVNYSMVKLAARHLDSPDPIIREAAVRAQQKLEAYRAQLRETLINSGADLARDDLLEWVDGRKGWLFLYYGLVIQATADRADYPFKHALVPKAQLGYRFENQGPWHLEEEIRTDLGQYDLPLPERIISSKESTKPLSEAIQTLKANLLPQIKNWSTLSDDVKKSIKQQLLELNGWDKREITVDMFDLSQHENEAEQTIQGTIKNSPFGILLSTYNFMMWPMSLSGPDHVGSAEHFLQIYSRFNRASARAMRVEEVTDIEVVAKPDENKEAAVEQGT